MELVLENGVGDSTKAKVESENNALHVKPFPNDIHSRSEKGRAFNLYLKRDLATADTEQILGVFTYNGSGRMVIAQMKFSMSISNGDKQWFRIEVHRDPLSVSGGTVVSPNNLNTEFEGEVGDTTAISGDSTAISATIQGRQTEMYHCTLCSEGNTNDEWRPDEAYILTKGKSVIVTAKGNGVNGSLAGARCTMRYFEEDIETK